MVYTSLPPYMDPANWHQQQPNHQVANNSVNTPLLIPSPQPQPSNLTPSQSHGGSIRPGSMADRARMANIPMQEPAQKCPRCDSTNTKFCYFNNYSLSQPRHFCKTCRRYWTRGGALRSVPVGGGCRRNKRTKSSNNNTSKSPVSSDRQTSSANNNSPAVLSSQTPPPMRFMAPLHQLGDHIGEIGLNYGFSSPMGGVGDLNFHIGNSLGGASGGVGSGGVTSAGGGSASILPVGGFEQWRMPQTHQFPFLSGLEASSSHGLLYPFEGGGGGGNDQAHVYGGVPKVLSTSSVKMEENQSRQFLGMINSNNNNNNNNPNSEQYWNASAGGATSAWADLSAFNSSNSTTTNSNFRS